MQKITTFLTFNNQAEEAVRLYTSVFNDSKIGRISYYSETSPMLAGLVMTIAFQLNGQEFIALNGGSHFTFTDGISLFVDCKTQEEVDTYWEKLSEEGEKGPCGWLKDKFGVSWQIVPSALGRMLQDRDPEKSKRVISAMMKMSKIDIAGLEKAYDG